MRYYLDSMLAFNFGSTVFEAESLPNHRRTPGMTVKDTALAGSQVTHECTRRIPWA